MLSLTAVLLGRMGYSVLLARDGAEAVAVFQEHASEIFCVLLDLTMPVMGGIEACDKILAIRSDVRVILSSGYSEEDMSNRSGKRAIAGFVQKPYRLSTLKALLQSLNAV